MPKRSDRPQSPKRDTAEPARARAKRSRTPAEDPVVTADDSSNESSAADPSEDDIRHRAYQRYLQRGGGHGMDFEDWLEAERELKTQK